MKVCVCVYGCVCVWVCMRFPNSLEARVVLQNTRRLVCRYKVKLYIANLAANLAVQFTIYLDYIPTKFTMNLKSLETRVILWHPRRLAFRCTRAKDAGKDLSY